MDRGMCSHCGCRPITPPLRKFCALHSRMASTLWKRASRRRWRAAGDPYWQSDWVHKTVEERRKYFREYMRGYRRRAARAGSTPASRSEVK